jgi:hypothetical protein
LCNFQVCLPEIRSVEEQGRLWREGLRTLQRYRYRWFQYPVIVVEYENYKIKTLNKLNMAYGLLY